jgi:hypothetical protein
MYGKSRPKPPKDDRKVGKPVPPKSIKTVKPPKKGR